MPRTRPPKPSDSTLQYIGDTLEELVGAVGRLSNEAKVSWPKFKIEIQGMEEALDRLGRIEQLLKDIKQSSTGRLDQMADTLDDVRSNLQELNVDVDTAVTGIASLRSELEQALANAGVDQAARDEIMGLIDGAQTKLVAALNPAVPVDPGTVDPVDPGLLQ